jgi:putative phosphoribosyl transferase
VLRLGLADPVVLALPRGGVPVAYEVAAALGASLEVFVARKVAAPRHPEYGIGAVAEGDGVVATEAVAALGITAARFAELACSERRELERRVRRYRGSRALPELRGRDVVLVDDGLATGVTAEAALRGLRGAQPRCLVLVVPVCSPAAARSLSALADDVVCMLIPSDFRSVGGHYRSFGQASDEEVVDLLERAGASHPQPR